jgi:hypothetical protein
MQHDCQQDAGEDEEDRGFRVPECGGDSEHDDNAERCPHGGLGGRPRQSLRLVDDGGLEAHRAFGHGVTLRDLRGDCADMRG